MAKTRNAGAATTQETAARIAGNYAAFQYHAVEFLADHLADCSRTFGGDLQQMLVLAIIGQMALHARRRPADAPVAAASITASRIADVTGIPRETVRRKLLALEARGWIAREADGGWRLAMLGEESAARRDLQELDQRSIARWATLIAAVRPLV